MKAAMFRKDGMGAVVGRLKSPNEVQYEDNGTLKVFQLTGNVVDTEFNDVLIVGKKVSENTLEVAKMESLPDRNGAFLGFKAAGDMGELFCMAIPKCCVIDVEEKMAENGAPYKKFHAKLTEKMSLFLNVFNEYHEKTANGCYVFLLKEAPTTEHNEFGTGFAKKQWTVKYGTGYQVLS